MPLLRRKLEAIAPVESSSGSLKQPSVSAPSPISAGNQRAIRTFVSCRFPLCRSSSRIASRGAGSRFSAYSTRPRSVRTTGNDSCSLSHAVRQFFLALGDEGLERLIDRRIERRGFILAQHAFPGLIGALGRILAAVVAPLLEGAVVGNGRAPEGGLEIGLGVSAAQEMRAGAHLANGIERLTVVRP